jgi:serine/threonine-protein kinase
MTGPPVRIDLEEIWGISWVCVWIVVFPLIVPTTPFRAGVVAVASALLGSLAYLFWAAIIADYPSVPPVATANMLFPALICALLATLEARIVYRMGRDLEKARRMGSYQLVERLGEGGMGEVWRAQHRMLARPAAIKLVRPEFLGDGSQAVQILKRFEREAQATAALTSPHSIDLYDFGTTEAGDFYYVMELLDGLDLETLIERFGPVKPERAIHFLSQASHSLSDAHHQGLIHRDIKPANIYTCRMGQELDFVKVLDFGLVKHSELDQPDTKLTAESVMTGTPAYMSPEAALGRDADARADLYSLGCVAFWLLTGRLLFEGDTAMEILMHHVKTQPPAPSAHSELPIPQALDEIVLWCLEKERDNRPSSAGELLRRLDAIAPEEPWTPERAGLWWEKHMPPTASRSGAERGSLHSARTV